ncbi:hypothetical protein [Metabacillus rhizolycopersici]
MKSSCCVTDGNAVLGLGNIGLKLAFIVTGEKALLFLLW